MTERAPITITNGFPPTVPQMLFEQAKKCQTVDGSTLTMKYLAALILILLTPSTCRAQIDSKDKYDVHEPIVLSVQVDGPEGSQKQVIWEVTGEAKIREIGADVAIWAPPGPYEVSAIVLLTIKKDVGDVVVPGGFRQYRAEFIIGPGDPPPPPPSTCDDVETATGQAICKLVTTTVPKPMQVKRVPLAAIYVVAAEKLETGKFSNPSQAAEYLADERGKILDSPAAENGWKVFGGRASELFEESGDDRKSLIEFYRDMALGLAG